MIRKGVDTTLAVSPKKWQAAGWIVMANMSVWAFDRYLFDEPWARIDLKSVKKNFSSGFVWDNDGFSTNLFAHPYHGGLYYNAARSNGMNFWQSTPFAAGGSLMWEFFFENEAPSVNDFFATTFGGICLGEVAFRISDLIIDDRTTGLNRLTRESFVTLISPIRGLNRLINGDSWKHRSVRGNVIPDVPVSFYSTFGYRIMAENMKQHEDVSNIGCLNLGLNYGDPYNLENSKPFDFFIIMTEFNLFSAQPIISRVSALGPWYSTNIALKKPHHQLTLGLFQHFNFYESSTAIEKESLNPYKVSEAASLGPGLLYRFRRKDQLTFSASSYLSAILLGGSQTDHYMNDKRDYNLGSGFSFKINIDLLFNHHTKIFANTEYYRVYTWIGNNPDRVDNKYASVQGDIGTANLNVANLGFSYIVGKHLLLGAQAGYYYRYTDYKYYPDITHNVTENKLYIGYIF
ncbi:MAG: DUF3943 domain-containing protein [Bacteroidota bacterium]|nr:DUF3943 domain-containing protein [Bacteroidota bacterium]